MALLDLEGFEGLGTTDDTTEWYMRKMYPGASPDELIGQNSVGRIDGRAWKGNNTDFFFVDFPAKQTIIVGFAFQINSWSNGSYVVRLRDIVTSQITLEIAPGGELKVLRGTTLLGTTSGLGGTINTWYYVELKVTIDNGTSGSYELRVDGVNVLSNPAVDTQETTNATVDAAFFMCNGSPIRIYDDIYILDDSGSFNNDFLGDMHVVMLSPENDGDINDFTIYPNTGEDHYEDVDDGVTVDYDATYVESSNSGDKELYIFEDLVELGVDGIAGVKLHTDAKKTDVIKQKLGLLSKLSGTETTDSGLALPSSYIMPTRLMETDPLNNQWTRNNLNSTQFGFKVF